MIATGDLGAGRATSATLLAIGIGAAPFVPTRWLAPVPIAVGAALAPTAPAWALIALTVLALAGVAAVTGPLRRDVGLAISAAASGLVLITLAAWMPRSADGLGAPFAAAVSGALLLGALIVSHFRRSPVEVPA